MAKMDVRKRKLFADPTAVATAGAKNCFGEYNGEIYVHKTGAKDTNWEQVTVPAALESLAANSTPLNSLAANAAALNLLAPQEAKVASLAGGGWADTIMLRAQALAPSIGTIVAKHADPRADVITALGANWSDAGVTGGAYKYAVAGSFASSKLTGGVVLNPTGGQSWAVAMRGILSPTGVVMAFALANSALSAYAWLLVQSGSSSKLRMQIGSTVIDTSFSLDGGVHDYMMVCDGTHLYAVVDGTTVGTINSLSGGPNTVSYITVADQTDSAGIIIYDYAWLF